MLALALWITTAAVAPVAAQDPAPDPPCRIVGRLVDPDGAPVAGARLSAHGWGANQDRILQHGVPDSWSDPEPVETGADGRFALEFVPPRAFQFTLKAEREGCGKVGWRWSAIEPGAALDLGDTVLEPPAVIVGHIVDAAGNLLVEGWRVNAWHNWNSPMNGRSSQGSYVNVDPATGTFRIEDLPPGRIRIGADSAAGTHLPETWVETVGGRVNEVELVHAGVDERTRLVVTITTRPFYPFEPDPGTVRAIAADGSVHALAPAPGRANDWHATGLAPGAYTVEIDDPRFESWRQEGAQTGKPVRARLVGSAALRVTVRTAPDGPPLTAYGLRATYVDANFSPNTFALAEDGALAPPDGLFRGVVPGELELELRAPDRPPQRARVRALGPGETRAVDVLLGEALALRGRVVRAGGGPAAGVRVQLTRGDVPGHDGPPGSTSMMFRDGKRLRIGYRDAEVTTDAEGGFAFEGLAPDVYALRALDGPYATVDAVVELSADTPAPTLELPGTGAVELALTLSEDVDVARLRVRAAPVGTGPQMHFGPGPAGEPIGPDGACRLEGLPAGEVELVLLIDRSTPQMAAGGASSWDDRTLCVLRVPPGGVARHAADLRGKLPGRVQLRTDLAGPAAEGVEASLVGADGVLAESARGLFPGTGLTFLDAPPGTWLVRLSNARGGWSLEHPEPLTLAPAGALQVELAVPLVARALRAVGPDGKPRAGVELTWWSAGLAPGAARATTDAAGLVRLELPPGGYSLARAADAVQHAARFTWAAGEGPLDVALPDAD